MAGVDLLIMAKFPTPGLVKTRMCPPLSDQAAADLHTASLRATCELAAAAGGAAPVLVASPDDAVDRFRTLMGPMVACVIPQGEGLLGERLSRAANWALARGSSGVILLGADSPTLPRERLIQAALLLDEHDAVMGPTDDGGYYLIGLAAVLPPLFEGIDWGSSSVADQTRRAARSAGIGLVELEPWYDLDRPEDLARADVDLRNVDSSRCPRAASLAGWIHRWLKGSQSHGETD